MFRRKITRKLTLLVATSLVLLMGIVVAAQFLIVSRNYMTTDYTKARVDDLQEKTNAFMIPYQEAHGETNKIISALNRYAKENSCCCLITK